MLYYAASGAERVAILLHVVGARPREHSIILLFFSSWAARPREHSIILLFFSSWADQQRSVETKVAAGLAAVIARQTY
jgi:hypothetical protein